MLKAELAERNENRATISEYETRVESVSEKTDEGELALPLPELEKIEKQIISDYLDGVTIHTLSLRHKVREISLRKLIEDHDLPLKITRNMLIERIKIIYKNGASRQEIERRFAHLGERQVVLMLKQKSKPHDKKEFVKEDALPEKEKKKIEFTEDIIKAIIEEYKTGAPPDEIAKNRMVKLSHVLKLLRASRCYKSYYQKEIKNLTVRDAAIVDYYKRGWNLLELKSEFNTSAWKIQRVLDKNKLKPEDENPFSEKRTKADLAVNYFKKGKSIFDIAELLEMTAERVEYLLRKKGVLEEEDFI
ncbi:MAG TPA: hypothetical protein VJY62_00815 [Bacteroidia bacterium]|nr:hypothetical protein [Bacteroidia bacterium]